MPLSQIYLLACQAMQEQYLSDFDFELPPELIAQYPLKDRTASRLFLTLTVGSSQCLCNRAFGSIHLFWMCYKP